MEEMLTTVAPSQRTREDWGTLAETILPEIQAEGSLTPELREKYDIGSVYRLKIALANIGFDIHGNPMTMKPIAMDRPARAAKTIFTRREKGEPYWLLEAETGMSPLQMQKFMEKHGFSLPATNGH